MAQRTTQVQLSQHLYPKAMGSAPKSGSVQVLAGILGVDRLSGREDLHLVKCVDHLAAGQMLVILLDLDPVSVCAS